MIYARFTYAINGRIGDIVWEQEHELPDGLTALLAEHDLSAPATYSDCHVGDSITWLAPGSGASSRIDFILIPVGWCCRGGNSRVLLDVDFGHTGIDHFGVYLHPEACLACEIGGKKPAPRIDVAQLATPEAEAVVARICAEAPAVPWHVDAHTHYDQFADFLAGELSRVFPGHRARKRRTFFSSTTWDLRQQRVWLRKTIRGLSRAVSCHHIRRAFFFWRHGANEYSWVTDIVHLLRSVVELQQHVADLRALQRVFRRAIATDRREYLRGVARDAISSDVKDTVRKLRPLLGPPRRLQRGVTALPAVRLEDGSLAPDKAAADKRWLRHFSSIEDGAPIGREEHVQACLQRQGELDLDGLELTKVDVPTRVELERSMRRTACNRAVGNDQLPGDVIHLHTATLSKPVYQIFLKVAYRLSEPLHWKGGTLHSLWKKGDQTLCSSYRAILVSSAVCTV